MALEFTARKQLAEVTPLYRTAPHNIELEQALLGAILVNNEAFYRVSDFLEPRHFFEPIHQKVYEVTASLVRVGKTATPITLWKLNSERPSDRRRGTRADLPARQKPRRSAPAPYERDHRILFHLQQIVRPEIRRESAQVSPNKRMG